MHFNKKIKKKINFMNFKIWNDFTISQAIFAFLFGAAVGCALELIYTYFIEKYVLSFYNSNANNEIQLTNLAIDSSSIEIEEIKNIHLDPKEVLKKKQEMETTLCIIYITTFVIYCVVRLIIENNQ